MFSQLLAPLKCVLQGAPCNDESTPASSFKPVTILNPRDQQNRFFMNRCSTNLSPSSPQPNWCGGECKDTINTPILGGKEVSGSGRGLVYCPFGINGANPPDVFAAPTNSLVPQMNPRPLNKVGWEWRN